MYNLKHPLNEIAGREISLTNREKTVLKLLSGGLQYKEIASKLFISIETVKCHVKKIYFKLNVNNRTEAILKYLNINFIT
jgi:NarL family two-component system response regulator LiaR